MTNSGKVASYRPNLLAGLSVSALMVLFSPAAQAQTGGTGTQTPDTPAVAAAGTDANSGTALGEIVVTAQKRAENVQDIPKSVQVITPRELLQNNVTSINDLRNVAPSISGTGLSIRGVATSASFVGAQNKVGLVVDDVPQISRSISLNQLVDVERVEVLPGPQGTLSGRNATGGLINIVTRGPTNVLTGNALLTATTDHQFTGSAFLAGPLSDSLGFSLSGYHDHFRGLAKNITVNKWASRTIDGVRGKLRWKPNNQLTVLGTLFYEQTIGYGQGDPAAQIFEFAPPSTFFVFAFGRPFSEAQPGVTPSATNNEYAAPSIGKSKSKSKGGILKADYDLGPATLTYVGSHMEDDRPETAAFVPAPLSFVPPFLPVGDGLARVFSGLNYDTQEIRIASPTNDRLTYIAGAIYTNNKNIYNYQRTLFTVDWDRMFKTVSKALYGHVDYDIVEPLTVSGGLRYEVDKASYVWRFKPTPFNPADVTSANSNTDRYWNYDFGLQYRPAERVMFYATYSKASQGRIFDAENNVDAVRGPLQPLPAEQVKDIEAGVKSTFLDGRLRLNVNLFNGKYRNYQVSSIILDQTNAQAVPTLLLASVGRVVTRGVEVSSSFKASRALRFDLAAAYTDAKIKDFPNAPCYTGQTAAQGCVPITPGSTQNVQRNLAGARLASTPKLKIVTTATYTRPTGLGADLELAGTVRYQSAQITNVLQEPSSRLDAYTVVNLSAGLRTERWSAQLFVNNLFDSGDLTFSNSAFLYASLPFDPPLRTHSLNRDVNRYAGVRLGFNF